MAAIDISTFPDRAECFGLFNLTNTTCTMPTSTMIDFLNITDYNIYKKMYCVNPPQDSCAFGYCPNPDIGSPAVRFSTSIQTLCFSILIYYSPDEIVGALYAQMLSAITAAVAKQLSVFHALIVLNALGSPLALFLTIYALRGVLDKAKEMGFIFSPGKVLNRTLVVDSSLFQFRAQLDGFSKMHATKIFSYLYLLSWQPTEKAQSSYPFHPFQAFVSSRCGSLSSLPG